MKKTRKIFIIILICLAICQITFKVFGYSLDEAMEIVEYKTVEKDGKPDKYDVLIDLSQLKDDEEIPIIPTSIDTIIYVSEGMSKLLDINFFAPENANNNSLWNALSTLVKTLFRISLYLSASALLTLLIYIANLITTSAITQKKLKMPFEKFFNVKDKNPKKKEREKRIIEQWFKTVILLSLLTVIITLMTYFSSVITNISKNNEISGQDNNYITVYVANLNGAVDTGTADIDTTGAYYFKTNLEGLLMFESQYKADSKTNINALCLTVEFFVAGLKYLLVGLFIFRVLALAVLTAISPIIVLINGFIKISGAKGILTKWTKRYLYFLLLRPSISILYFMLIKANTYLVTENPIYVLFIVFVMVILIILSIKRILLNKNQ